MVYETHSEAQVGKGNKQSFEQLLVLIAVWIAGESFKNG